MPVDHNLMENCISTANELLRVLREETEVLRRFESKRLLALLPQKESLARELATMVNTLQSSLFRASTRPVQTGSPAGQDVSEEELEEKRLELKGFLAAIHQCNYENHIFIQGSLDYWRDLTDLLMPGVYGRVQDGQAATHPLKAKGLSLNREV